MRVDQPRRQVFRARSARVAGLALLETAVQRQLAAADLLIALCLGRGPPAILSTPRAANDTRRPLALAKFGTIWPPCEKFN
jgi:hypothetical protein